MTASVAAKASTVWRTRVGRGLGGELTRLNRQKLQRERALDKPREAEGEKRARDYDPHARGPGLPRHPEEDRPAHSGDRELADFDAEVECEQAAHEAFRRQAKLAQHGRE